MSSTIEGIGGASSSIDLFDMDVSKTGSLGEGSITDAVKDSIGALHERLLEADATKASMYEVDPQVSSVDAQKMALTGVGDAAPSANIGGDGLGDEQGGSRFKSDMPHRDDVDVSAEKFADVIRNMGERSITSAMFVAGASVATKADASIKMFVQAQ